MTDSEYSKPPWEVEWQPEGSTPIAGIVSADGNCVADVLPAYKPDVYISLWKVDMKTTERNAYTLAAAPALLAALSRILGENGLSTPNAEQARAAIALATGSEGAGPSAATRAALLVTLARNFEGSEGAGS